MVSHVQYYNYMSHSEIDWHKNAGAYEPEVSVNCGY